MNKKVALINPPYREHLSVTYPVYPLGLGYLQASCTDNNIVCDLFDFSQTDLSDIELINKYQLYEYKIIGITSFSIDFIRTAQFIDKMKTENNYIIVGGHHATQTAGILLKEFSTIDYIIKGYGEKVFPRLVNIIFLNELDLLNGLSGVCFRMNGNIIENEIDYSDLDVEFVSFPSRDKIIFDYNKNVCLEKGSDTLTISSSRGCPYSCTFCVNCKNDYWMSRSENSVIAEIKENILNYDYKTISFVDCNFFVDINRALGILEHIHNNYPNKIITFQLRADQICMFEDVVKRISSYNLLIEVGIEACSLDGLKRYNKMTTPEINQKAIDILKKNKINFVAYMIMFEALEDLSDIRANFNFIKKK